MEKIKKRKKNSEANLKKKITKDNSMWRNRDAEEDGATMLL